LCKAAKKSSRIIANLDGNARNAVLRKIASGIRENEKNIIEENKKDLVNGEKSGLSSALIDRLTLNKSRIEAMAVSVEDITKLPDPVGRIEKIVPQPSGIRVGQMRVPVGVIFVIFESRPNVIIDIAALAIKSGNAAILRGGKEAINTNSALYRVVVSALETLKLPADIIRFVEKTDRDLVDMLLKKNEYIDIVIPRGGESLIKAVCEKSTIPVIKHDKGVCHTYIDASADREMAVAISLNAKIQRPSACNAMETLLINGAFPYAKELLQAIAQKNVEIRGCQRIKAVFPGAQIAVEEDWSTEYLDLVLSVKMVDGFDEMKAHIEQYGSGHSESIVTRDHETAERFLREIDSAAVMVNASTRFHDGGEFGLGAEVGISTQKLHARGAMGIEGLTCLKYIVYGNGQVRS
jgi:glutamate-5-semialdehyde dehydrogenase